MKKTITIKAIMKRIPTIKRTIAAFFSALIICFTCTSPAIAATSDRIFFGAGIDIGVEGVDTAWWLDNLSSKEIPAIVKSKGYSGSESYYTINANDAFGILKNKAGIFAVETHGNATCVQFSNNTYIYKSQIDSLPSGALKNVDLVVYGACECAKGGSSGSNMVNSTYNKGAKAVIGFEDTIYVDQTNQWLFDFFKSYSNGKSITESAKDGLYWAKFWNFGNAGGTDTYLIRQ